MLIYATIDNYKSFKERTTIDFRSVGISELKGNRIPNTPDNLLKSISIMGPNASGKSNLTKALVVLRYFIVNALSLPLDDDGIPVDPYRLDEDTRNEPTTLELEILVKGKRYIYGISMTRDKVHQEWLFERLVTTTKMIFTRENGEIELSDEIAQAKQTIQFVDDNIPFLTVGAKFKIELLKNISQWFVDMNTLDGLQSEDYMGLACTMIDHPELKPILLDLVKAADIGITDIKLERISGKDDSVKIKTIHLLYNSEGKVVGETEFDLSIEESKGTRKYFSLIGMVIDSILNKNLLIIDELDSRLHGDLVNEILRLYNSPLNKGSQLLSVNLQASVLEPNLLRRDQVYIVEKDIFGESHITTMVEYDIRKSQSMAKHYRDHKVGGRPAIENFENVFVHE